LYDFVLFTVKDAAQRSIEQAEVICLPLTDLAPSTKPLSASPARPAEDKPKTQIRLVYQ
jgi:hypothetical protein